MPINRISGNILQDDLVRGANLSFQGNLLTLDVVNDRVGIGTDTPQSRLEIQGNLQVANIIVQADGNITMGNGWINNLQDPVESQDAATKNYVDSQISSGFTIEDDVANTTVVSGGDTLRLLGTANQVTVAITDIDEVTFGLPTDVVISGTVSTANVLTNAISGGNIVVYGNSVDFQLASNITVSGSLIRDMGNPVAAQDAATKQYVDDAVSTGITIHPPVDVESPNSAGSLTATYAQGGNVYTVTDTVAGNTVVFSTAANLQVNDQLWFTSGFDGIVANLAYFVVSTPNTSSAALSTAYNGAPVANITGNTGLSESVRVNSGQGATLTNAGANATLVIDGVTMTGGERVLIYNQTNGYENGVYDVTVPGDAGNAWVLTRSVDMNTYIPDNVNGVDAGDYFFVLSGDTGAGESYVMTAPMGPLIIGHDSLTFTQFSASQVYSANTNAGLSLAGTVFSAKIDGDTTYFDVGGNIAVRPGANLVTPNIGDATGNSLTLTGNGLVSAANVTLSGNVTASGVVANVSGVTAVFSNSVTALQSINTGNLTAQGWINAAGGNIWSSAGQVDLFTGGPAFQDIYIGGANSLQTTITSPVIALDASIATLINSPLAVESGGESNIYTNATTVRLFETTATTANVLMAGTNITIAATTGNTRIRNNVTVGGNLTANAITSNTSISAVTGVFSGNVTANNAVIGNNISASTGVFSGNVTADYFIGNIQGNIDAGGANTQIQFNDDDVLAGSAGFTFDKVSNAVVVSGTVTATDFLGNVQGDTAQIDQSLTVLGTTDLGNIGNVTITGGANLQYIQTDGTGNLTYSTPGTAANVLYVSKSGNDANDGQSLDTAKLTIAAAVAIATTNTCIFVKSGDYTEANPIVVPTRVSIIGDNLRTVSVRPQTTNQDLFHVNPACYLTGMTFRDHIAPAAAVAFPTGGAGLIVTSPYVQNCSSITTTGCGMRVDGNLASGLKSMVTDSYTQFNQGGIGIEITNQGYAQLVSIFTICCSEGIRCSNGGTCSITNSNSSFGDYGLVADGVGPVLYTGNVISTTRSTATIGNLSQRPAVNDAFIFSGQTQYQLVRAATPLIGNVSTVTFEETLEATPSPGDGVDFRQISLISASSHTFEYVGTGTNILTATPRLGGIPIQANEVREVSGGRVNYTSTDQFGDFRIGGGLVIKEEAGIIEGVTFDRSLFAVMTPYILALEG